MISICPQSNFTQPKTHDVPTVLARLTMAELNAAFADSRGLPEELGEDPDLPLDELPDTELDGDSNRASAAVEVVQ